MSFEMTIQSGLLITFIAFLIDAFMDRALMSIDMTFLSGLVTFVAFVPDVSMDCGQCLETNLEVQCLHFLVDASILHGKSLDES